MMRRLAFIMFLVLLIPFLASCGFTPPIAGPNQTPMPSVGYDVDKLEQLPLEELPPDSGNVEPGIGGGYVTANPSKIYTLDLTDGVVTAQTASNINVATGIFAPYSVVSVWGIVEDPDAIFSPPYVTAEDKYPDQEYIQMTTDENGELSFVLAAGYSPGYYIIMIGDNINSVFVAITIEGPKEM